MHDDHQHGIPPEGLSHWQAYSQQQQQQQQQPSLLGELYEHELPQPELVGSYGHDWAHSQQQHPLARVQHDGGRRATFPYVRQEREDLYSLPPFHPDEHRQQHHLYAEPMSYEQQQQQQHHYDQRHQTYPGPFDFAPSPSHHYRELEPRVKLEDTQPIIVPSHPQLIYRSPSLDGMPTQMLPPYLQAHPSIPIQHTDDAASKETQYLRRRCFNCSQTEPPSWRRSTLNPGKIVCNKCGLYERTHLRPRPLRFDELRTGNKGRKKTTKGADGSAAAHAPVSPPAAPASVKQEPLDVPAMSRRASMSSTTSSDWDDSVSVASSGSAPPSSFGSPAGTSYALPLAAVENSPMHHRDGGIRLPNVDMGLGSLSMGSPAMRPSSSSSSHSDYGLGQDNYFIPPQDIPLPSSMPGTPGFVGSPGSIHGSPALLARDMPEVSGWQGVDSSLSPPTRGTQRRPSVLRKTVVAS
jgi:GATA-binding protein